MLVAASPEASGLIRDLVFEFGITLDDKGKYVVDHIHRAPSSEVNRVEDHATVLASTFSTDTPILSDTIVKGEPVLYRGAAMQFNSNPLLVKILTGSQSSYSTEVKAESVATSESSAFGKDIVLVGSLQALNNARVTVAGSLDMFKNSWVSSTLAASSADVLTFSCRAMEAKTSDGKQSGNLAFLEEVSKWTFHERGVLHVRSVRHHKEGEKQQPAKYRIKDNIVGLGLDRAR